MPENYVLNKDDQLPVFWLAAIQEYIAALAPNIRITQPSLQSLRISADAMDGSGAGVQGLWRFVNTDADATHPGGGAGVYDVFLVASANDITSTPTPLSDDTDYNFYLQIGVHGSTPSGVTPLGNAIAATRKIGECDWDGTNITGFRQLYGATDTTLPLSPQAPSAQGYGLRVRGATGQASGAPIALVQSADGSTTYLSVYTSGVYLGVLNVSGASTLTGALTVGGLATLGGGLAVTGATSTGSLSITGAGTALTVTNNVTIGGTLGVTGATTVGGTLGVTGALTAGTGIVITGVATATANITAKNGAATAVTIGTVTGGNVSGISFQSGEAGSNLYRSGAGALTIDGVLTVGGAGTALTVTNNATVGGTLGVTGTATLGVVNASGLLTLSKVGTALSVTNNATVGGTLGVTGTTSLVAVNVTGAYTQTGANANTFSGVTSFTAAGAALAVTNNATVGGTLTVTGATALNGGAAVTGALTSTGAQTAAFGAATAVAIGAVGPAGKSGITFQSAEAGSNLYRSGAGALTIDGTLTVGGAGTALVVTNNATVGGTLGVTGLSTLGAINALGAVSLTAAGTALTVTNTIQTGTINAITDIKLNNTSITTAGVIPNVAYLNAANTFTAAGTALTVNNNTLLGGTLTVTGTATLSGGVAGALTVTGVITANSGSATAVATGAVGPSSKSGITFQNGEAGSNLYRTGAGSLTTDATLAIGGAGTALAVTNNATVGGTLGVTGTSTLGAINSSGAVALTAAGTALHVTNNATVDGILSGGTIELAGTNINNTGTLSNVAYLGQANTFTAVGTALTVNNNVTVGGSLNVSGGVVNTATSNVAPLSLTGFTPASGAGAGTAAASMTWAAGTGGATTGSATTAGTGGSFTVTAGNGGSGSGGTNASGGAGGSITLKTGTGGTQSGTGTAGTAGSFVLQIGATVMLTATSSMLQVTETLQLNSDAQGSAQIWASCSGSATNVNSPVMQWTANSAGNVLQQGRFFLTAAGVLTYQTGFTGSPAWSTVLTLGSGGALTLTNAGLTVNGAINANGFNLTMAGGNISCVAPGTMIGLSSAHQIGFFGANPIAQPTNTAAGGFGNGGGAAVFTGFTSTGGVGTLAYNFNMIVAVLKNLGLINS